MKPTRDLIIDETAVDAHDDTTVEILDETSSRIVGDIIVNETDDSGPELPPEATINDDGSVTLVLKYPKIMKIRGANNKVREEPYQTLTFHRLTGGDLNAIAAASPASAPWVGFARSTRIKEAIMRHLYEMMDGYDIANGAQVIEYFFPSGRKSGRKS